MIHKIHQSDIEKQAHATESTTEAVIIARNDIVEAIKAIPETIIPEAKDFPEIPDMTDKFDEIIKTIKEIPQTIIPEPKEFPSFPEQLPFPEILPTDMSKTNELLEKILNKEEKEYPEFPEIPESKEVDFSATNKLLQKLIDKNEDLEITATLNIK